MSLQQKKNIFWCYQHVTECGITALKIGTITPFISFLQPMLILDAGRCTET